MIGLRPLSDEICRRDEYARIISCCLVCIVSATCCNASSIVPRAVMTISSSCMTVPTIPMSVHWSKAMGAAFSSSRARSSRSRIGLLLGRRHAMTGFNVGMPMNFPAILLTIGYGPFERRRSHPAAWPVTHAYCRFGTAHARAHAGGHGEYRSYIASACAISAWLSRRRSPKASLCR